MRKLRALSAAAVAAAMAAALTVTASANWTPVDGGKKAEALSLGSDTWLETAFSDGSESDIPAADCGVDFTKVGGAEFTVVLPETDSLGGDNLMFFDGKFGGGVIASWHSSEFPGAGDTKEMYDKYNWIQQEFWGITDEDIPISNDPDNPNGYVEQAEEDKPFRFEKTGTRTYKLKVQFDNPTAAGDFNKDKVTSFRFGIKTWNADMYELTVERAVLLDGEGAALMAFDGAGNVSNIVPGDGASIEESVPESESVPETTVSSVGASEESQTAEKKNFPTGGIIAIVCGAVVITGAVVAVVAKKKK